MTAWENAEQLGSRAVAPPLPNGVLPIPRPTSTARPSSPTPPSGLLQFPSAPVPSTLADAHRLVSGAPPFAPTLAPPGLPHQGARPGLLWTPAPATTDPAAGADWPQGGPTDPDPNDDGRLPTDPAAALVAQLAAAIQRGAGASDDMGWSAPGLGTAAPRGTHAIQEIWRRLGTRPDQVIEESIGELRRRQGLAPHEPFTLMSYGRALNAQHPTFKSLKKFVVILGAAFDQGYYEGVGATPAGARLLAILLQSFKVVETAMISGGAWTDWELLPWADPEGPGRSLAGPAERAALAARRREEVLLAHAGGGPSPAAPSHSKAGGHSEGGASSTDRAARKPRPKGAGKGGDGPTNTSGPGGGK